MPWQLTKLVIYSDMAVRMSCLSKRTSSLYFWLCSSRNVSYFFLLKFSPSFFPSPTSHHSPIYRNFSRATKELERMPRDSLAGFSSSHSLFSAFFPPLTHDKDNYTLFRDRLKWDSFTYTERQCKCACECAIGGTEEGNVLRLAGKAKGGAPYRGCRHHKFPLLRQIWIKT